MTLKESLREHGFSFEDLSRPDGLERVDALFRDHLRKTDPALDAQLLDHRREPEQLSNQDESELLLALAPHLEAFIAALFGIGDELEALRERTLSHDPVFRFKNEFVQKRAKKRREDAPDEDFETLSQWLRQQLPDGTEDVELAVAGYALSLLDDESANAAAVERVTQWCRLARTDPSAYATVAHWASFKLPEKVDHSHLVPLEEVRVSGARQLRSPATSLRRRDGFELTDTRWDARTVQSDVHYCIYCHDHDGDFCSKGFPEKKRRPELGYKVDPLGNTLTGCPLEEKISEMHALKRDGHGIAALAVAMVDNPMIPATGHRICNDCMKGCIYQKQDPVNIPQIETRVLTDVLDLPWGVEVYHLLARWNPLRSQQFLPKRYNQRKVLIAGMGPAGFTMAHHLTQEGCAVVGVDGLKIEPLPQELLNGPVRDYGQLEESLDERILLGFGGVAEYGITVRWDKNFLKLIYLTLARRHNFRVYGGVRLGGTLTLEDAWELGFDHVCNATGAGLPRVLHIGNSLARGMRQASDFLMALQLTGAGKESSIANLQVRLPAVVIGGGLTGIDTATEVQAYYVKQVEKILKRYETLTAERGEDALRSGLNEEDLETLSEFLEHGRAVRAERRRAAEAGEAPDFIPLLQRWGGVTIAYRKGMNSSPAYTRNHEEVQKAVQEGIFYAEGLDPIHVELDEHRHVSALVARRMECKEGRWLATPEEITLPARAVFVAAGTVPNTIYEREYKGTFELEGDHFRPFVDHADGLQPVDDADHCKSREFGPFTSYEHGDHRVSFLGDTHPAFNGSVVKAIASAQRSYPQVMAAMDVRPAEETGDEACRQFLEQTDDLFTARVVSVNRDNPAMVEVWVRAPMAARSFRPGQFFRLQTFETGSPVVEGTRLQVPLITVSGTGVKDDMIRLLVLQWGAGPRLVGRLEPGDPLVLMGPTGAPTDMPEGKTIMVVAGRWGAAVMLDIGAALRAAGNRVLYVGAFGAATDVDHQEELEAGADQIIWCTASEPTIEARRPQDISLVETDMLRLVRRYGDGEIARGGDSIALNEVDRVMVMGGTGLLKGFQSALKSDLKRYFAPNCQAYGTVGSPMQCMLKGVCAQCLQWQIDPQTGERTRPVFSCAGQDQPLSWVDLDNLAARQQQNRLSDRITGQWVDYVLSRVEQNG